MVRFFQVAGLVFSLDLPDGHPAADLLHNYDPFSLETRPDSQPRQTSGCAGPLPTTSSSGPSLLRSRGWLRSGEAAVGSAVLFRLELSDQRPGAPGEPLLKPQEKTGEPVVGFFRSGEGYQAVFAPGPGAPVCGVLEMSGDFREGRLFAEGSPSAQAFAINNALMLLFAFASAPYAALEMHASVALHGGRGFLFLGKSGTGKSTHTRLWLDHIPGTELLNDDNPVLRIIDGQARVFGSPWSGKTPCYKAQDAPVGAIVRLRQAPYNRIERLGMVHAYGSVMASCSGFRPIRSLADAQHETLSVIAQQVPCYQLECLPDEAAARLCQETIDA
jgi:hypothetical protein